MAQNGGSSTRVALAGLGAIGTVVASRLQAGLPGLELTAVAVRDRAKARANLLAIGAAVPIVDVAELPARADVIVECAPAAVFRAIAVPALQAGRIFMPLSVGGLLQHDDLVALAKRHGGRILPPTGALLGLDAVRAAAQGVIHEVRMVTTKPPRGLAGAPYLAEKGIDVMAITTPTRIFAGTAREGARGFPANVNVAAALSLAGIGPDRTTLEIWADPGIGRNRHEIHVDADSARFTMTIENVPSEENPRTGKITALSVVAALRKLTETLVVGS